MKTPFVLTILDGYGLRSTNEGNAIAQATTPNLDSYLHNDASTKLQAAGEAVGLPEGMMGSSEVGHLNIGAGRTVKQEVTLINEAINTGEFFQNDTLLNTVQHLQNTNGTVHIMGLLSDEGVHAHTDHLYALLRFYTNHDITPKIHAFTDGRDTPPKNAVQYFNELDDQLTQYNGELATITGRYYAMDRDENWNRTKQAYDAIIHGDGQPATSWQQCLETAYANDETDEFITPRIIDHDGVEDNDIILCYNYRTDRPRQITKALVEDDFDKFQRDHEPVSYIGMVPYYDDMPAPYLYKKRHPHNGLGQVLSDHGISQARIAETEKEAHVTYFFNGEVDTPYPGETRVIHKSPDVDTYEQAPAMRANTVRDSCINHLDDHDVLIVNFANCDMVGHTGDFESTVQAVETVDACVRMIVEAVQERNGVIAITADHGNAEYMQTGDGDTVTSHTTAPVPFTILQEEPIPVGSGTLGDIAPTMLEVMQLPIPQAMTGTSLLT